MIDSFSRRLVLFFVLIGFTSGIVFGNEEETCSQTFQKATSWAHEFLAARRQYIHEGEKRDAHKLWLEDVALFSQAIGNEVNLPVSNRYMQTISLPDTHAIAIASGPDLFNLVTNFPLAENYHFVDFWLGWGDSPGFVLQELVRRIKNIHPLVEVSCISEGFLVGQNFQDIQFSQDQMNEILNAGLRWRRPAIFRLHWPNSNYPDRNIFIHATDIQSSLHVSQLLEHLPKRDPLVGVTYFGLTLPWRHSQLEKILLRIHPGGVFKYSADSDETLPFYETGNLLSRLNFSRLQFRLNKNFQKFIYPATTENDPYDPPLAGTYFHRWMLENSKIYVFEKR